MKNEGKLDKAATMYIHLGWFRVFGVSYKADVLGQYLSKSRSGCINIEHKTYVNLAHKQINLRYSTERRYLNRVSLREQFPSYILEWGDRVSSLLLSYLIVFLHQEFCLIRGLLGCVDLHVNFQTRSTVCLFESWLIDHCTRVERNWLCYKRYFIFYLKIIWIYSDKTIKPVNSKLQYISVKFEIIPSDLFDN